MVIPFAQLTSVQPHHEITRQEFLEELCLLVLNSFDDELVVAGHIEDGSAGSGVGQLNQWIITQRVLQGDERGREQTWWHVWICYINLKQRMANLLFWKGCRRQLGKSNQISADKTAFWRQFVICEKGEQRRKKEEKHSNTFVCEKPICHHWSLRAPEKHKTTHASNKCCTKARKRPSSRGDKVGRQISESYESIHYLCLLRTA